MFTNKETSVPMLTIDEIRWLDAESRAGSYPSPNSSPVAPVAVSSLKAISPPTSIHDSPHARNISRRHTHQHHISAKSNASLISLHSPNEIAFNNVKTPHRLRCILTPPTPIPTPPPESLPTSHQQTHPWNAYNSYNGTSPSLTHLQPVIPPTPPPSPPRPSPEWIYRRPKSPHSHSRSRSITPTSSPPARPRPQTGYSHPHPRLHSHSHVPSHSHHHRHHHHNHQQNTFWSAVLRPRSRSERSLPMLKAKAAELPTLPPKAMHIRAPSIASTISTSSTSSRPQTPTSPQKHQPHHRSSKYTSPNPSKSILARTASISTKNSASTTGTGNKSVKFVDMPTIHYASAGYWDIDSIYLDGVGSDSMDTGMEMDMDVDMRDVLCSTPTPEKEKAKGLKRLISLTRKPSQTAPASHRTISGPFVLGTVSTPPPTLAPIPSLPSLSDTSPYFKSTSKSKGASISGPFPLRTASSLESFRSTKSSGGRSVRSLGSVRSNKNTGIFRAWLGRMGMGVGCSVS